MKKKWLAVLSFTLLVILCASFVGRNLVMAAGGGQGQASGTKGGAYYGDSESGPVTQGCGQTYDTCYGLTWRYYAWPGDATSVTIPGSSNPNYKSITISGREAEVCKAAGGYYRYAFVNRNTGEQYGTMTLAAHQDKGMRTQMIVGSGGAHYRGVNEGGDDWNAVKAAYDAARANYPNDIPAGGFENGSGLRVFCATKGNTPTPEPGQCNTNSGTTTNVVTTVRNNSVGGQYGDIAWVGVGQQADWKHCYYPGVQKQANKLVSTIKKPGDWTCGELMPHTTNYNADGLPQYWQSDFVDGTISISSNYYYFTNVKLYTRTTWQNQLTFSRNFGNNPAGKSYTIGDSGVKEEHNYYTVNGGNVSNVLTETGTTGTPTVVSTETTGKDGIRWACQYEWRWTAANGVEPAGCDESVVCGQTSKKKKTTCKKMGWVQENGYWTNQCVEYNYEIVYEDVYCGPGDADYPDSMRCRTHYDTYSDTRAVNFWNGTDYTTWSTNAPDTASSSASVKVPINYSISGKVSIPNSIYAGETVAVNDGILSNTGRWNNVTRNAYATNAGEVKYRLISYVSSTNDQSNSIVLGNDLCAGKSYCKQSDVKSAGGISANSNKAVTGLGTLHIPDVKAGNYFCVALAFYPTNSGDYTNLGNWNGNGQWGTSSVSCQVVMKKPTIQVWGASVYSAGEVATSKSEKNNLDGAGYTQSGTVSSATIFGSWAEQAVVSLGKVTGLASGASGSKGIKTTLSGAYCNYFVPLSFANYFGNNSSTGCSKTQASGSMTSNVSNIISDREGLVNKVAPMTGVSQVSSTSNIDISKPASYQEINSQNGRKVRVTYSANSLSLAGANLTKGITHVVRSNGTITINSDITYDNDGYTEMGQVPKLIIFANNNINIKCNVSRIDAVLIANGNVYTCSDSNGLDSEKNSKQLKINGTVITNRLIARRTYGNATGANSAVPAEIINYDSSIILWSSVETDTSGTDTVNVTYQHELAPRY
ncbi:hypothetical protein IKW73_01680 [Candidatus Saccharibacteria bacterium]|nr:hypothetical protein [Candidatus Saccharibacteria bacterium]